MGFMKKPFSEVATLINGRAYSAKELLKSGKYRVLRVGNFFSTSDYYYSDLELEPNKYCEKGDLLYAWSATFGARIWEEERVIYHYHIWKVEYDNQLLDKEFLCFLLNEMTENLKHETHGSTMMHLTKEGMERKQIIIPPIRVQKSFVLFLHQADKSKFAGLKSQFIEQFSGENIPRYKLSSLCSVFLDGDWIESKDQSDAGYRLVQTGNVGVGEYIDKSGRARFVSEETFKRLNCTEIFSGDILFSRLPEPLGRCCIIPEDFPKAITAVDCTIARLNEKCLPEFLVVYTATSMYSSQVDKCVTGTTRQRISRNNLAKISVPCPSRDEQIAFVKIVRQADKSKYLS